LARSSQKPHSGAREQIFATTVRPHRQANRRRPDFIEGAVYPATGANQINTEAAPFLPIYRRLLRTGFARRGRIHDGEEPAHVDRLGKIVVGSRGTQTVDLRGGGVGAYHDDLEVRRPRIGAQ